jgi:AraC-like DNA-binding protein
MQCGISPRIGFKQGIDIVQAGLYGKRLGSSFRVGNPPALVTRTRGGFHLAVTELRHDAAGFGMSDPLPLDDAYLVALHLAGIRRNEIWLAGQLSQARPAAPGDLSFYDLQLRPVAGIVDPFHLLVFYVPRRALAEVSDDLGGKPLKDFGCHPDASMADPIVASLGQSLMPFLASGVATNQLYVDHVFLALRSHLAVTYGGMKPPNLLNRGGLAPWQRRRAVDLLIDGLTEGVRLDTLSEACGLSSSAFLRAFRKTMGLAPHQWLMARRVERARELIREGDQPLSEIALSSGFSDQSHLTRVFSQQMGVSPGAWRRTLATGAPAAPACIRHRDSMSSHASA